MIKTLFNLVLLLVLLSSAWQAHSDDALSNRKYVCPPCYHVDNIFETQSYHDDGTCPICGMSLIEQPFSEIGSPSTIHFGSGNFNFNSMRSGSPSLITVFYHKPVNYNSESRIVLIIPGAGRNAWEYRDSWVELSEKYNVLVASPFYPEEDYDYAAYHNAGITIDIKFNNFTVSEVDGRVNKYYVADRDVVAGDATQAEAWLFSDFDGIFDQVVRLTESDRKVYDIFGHSAGGQILHRMAIFHSSSKVDRIIASNSGSYTLPSLDEQYPFGLKGTDFKQKGLPDIFSSKLTLLVGEQDNDEESRGTMLHTPSLDKQGLGRLSRGKSFYNESKKLARELGSNFAWGFCVVEDVGHEHKKMSKAAAKLLYGDQQCLAKMSI